MLHFFLVRFFSGLYSMKICLQMWEVWVHVREDIIITNTLCSEVTLLTLLYITPFGFTYLSSLRWSPNERFFFFLNESNFIGLILIFFLFWQPHGMWSSWARDQIWASVVTYAAALATRDSLTHGSGPRIEPVSWCFRDAPQWELPSGHIILEIRIRD